MLVLFTQAMKYVWVWFIIMLKPSYNNLWYSIKISTTINHNFGCGCVRVPLALLYRLKILIFFYSFSVLVTKVHLATLMVWCGLASSSLLV